VLLVALAVVVVHVLLVRAMAHGHVAHVLLGSGNAAPPVGAALLAVSLVVIRLLAVVVAPGALLAALASLVAHALVGPPRGGDGQGDEAGTGTSSGTGKRSDPAGSGAGAASAGTGINIEGRATQ
jgi:hypothetical protein